jgi:predicted glycosyltransferase
LFYELKSKGHDVFLTSREYREVNLLASRKGLDMRIIGKHGGGSLSEKLQASIERSLQLSDLVKNYDLDYAISLSSPECARVSFGLGIKHLCVSDSPHSEKVCRLTIPLSQVLITPWIIPYSAWKDYGIENKNVISYKALDPVSWLKRRTDKIRDKKEYGLDPNKILITLRLDESQASYLLSSDHNHSKKLLDSLLHNFNDCEFFVLGRYTSQIKDFKELYKSRINISDDIVDGVSLLSATDVFIGMGGTMTSEAALLGVPTISAYQGGLLFTEEYLINQGLLIKPRSIEEIIDSVGEFLHNPDRRLFLINKAKTLVDSMDDPISIIVNVIENKI